MKEVKFRAWTDENGMGKPFTLQEAIEDSDPGFHSTEKVIYMQYTGLKDKNGKEIYEGDIVSFRLSGEDRIEQVVWEGDCFHANQYKHEEWRTEWDQMEVVGNIYENLELLKL